MALGLSGWDILTAVLGYIMALCLGIILHEVAHGFVALKCGDNTAKVFGRLSLNPMKHFDPMGLLCFVFIGFGWAKPVPINPLKFKNFKRGQRLVSLAGIVVNLILAFIFSGLYFFFYGKLSFSPNLFLNFVGYFILFGFMINISLAVFNLLPIYPLDGFNFLKSFLDQTIGLCCLWKGLEALCFYCCFSHQFLTMAILSLWAWWKNCFSRFGGYSKWKI